MAKKITGRFPNKKELKENNEVHIKIIISQGEKLLNLSQNSTLFGLEFHHDDKAVLMKQFISDLELFATMKNIQIEKKFQEAIAFASADKVSGDSIDVATIEHIVDSCEYADEQERKSAIDAVNNAICETTYLSNLYQIAQNIAREYRGY